MPTLQERLKAAMYRPLTAGGARSATKGPMAELKRHSPSPNSTANSPRSQMAASPWARLATSPTSQVTSQAEADRARVRERSRWRTARVIGSWATTMKAVLAARIAPRATVGTPRKRCAYSGTEVSSWA